MAALVLSIAGSALGGSVFGPVGAIAGRLVGALAGNAIDQTLFASHRDRAVDGPRLADLAVMASTEGAPIPRAYGRARLSGQVIWATNLEEVVSTATQTTGGGAAARVSAVAAAQPSPPRRRHIPTSPISRSACAKARSAR